MSRYLTPLLVVMVIMLSAVLFIRGGEVLTALAISSVNSTIAILNITTETPSVNDVRCFDAGTDTLLTMSSRLNLVGGDRKQIYCNATVVHPNGVDSIGPSYGSVHEDNAPNFDTCSEDDRNCYVNATCENFTDINSTAREIRCNYFLWFNADNTTVTGNWTPNITVNSTNFTQSFGGMTNRTNFSVDTLLAIGVPPVLNFGSKSSGVNMTTVGGNGTVSNSTYCNSNCNQSVQNYGNVQIDFQINASSLTCTVGSIPAGFLKANITFPAAYVESYSLTALLTDSASFFAAFNLDENNTAGIRNADAPIPTTKLAFWGVGVPVATSGNCQGLIHYAAVLS